MLYRHLKSEGLHRFRVLFLSHNRKRAKDLREADSYLLYIAPILSNSKEYCVAAYNMTTRDILVTFSVLSSDMDLAQALVELIDQAPMGIRKFYLATSGLELARLFMASEKGETEFRSTYNLSGVSIIHAYPGLDSAPAIAVIRSKLTASCGNSVEEKKTTIRIWAKTLAASLTKNV